MSVDDEYFEFLLKRASDEYCKESGREYIEKFADAEKAMHSKEFLKSMERLSRKSDRSWTRKLFKAAEFMNSVFNKDSSTAYDVGINNGISQANDTGNNYFELSMFEGRLDKIPDGWKNIYVPLFLPSGLAISEAETSSDFIRITYRKDADYILFDQYNAMKEELSAESKSKKIEIRSLEVSVLSEGADSAFIWNKDGYTFYIKSNMSEDKITSFIRGINKYEIG